MGLMAVTLAFTATRIAVEAADTGHHSAETKNTLKETLQPAATEVSERALDFAASHMNSDDYTVSVIDYPAGEDRPAERQTTISHYYASDSGNNTFSSEAIVRQTAAGELISVSFSRDTELDGEELQDMYVRISGPEDEDNRGEWYGVVNNDGRVSHTGDQGFISNDPRSDEERAVMVAGELQDQAATFFNLEPTA